MKKNLYLSEGVRHAVLMQNSQNSQVWSIIPHIIQLTSKQTDAQEKKNFKMRHEMGGASEMKMQGTLNDISTLRLYLLVILSFIKIA